MWTMINLGKNIFKFNFNTELKEKCKNNFHRQIIESWGKFSNMDPITVIEINDQFIMYNRHITINNKS